jgi:hypothetical protein
VFKNVQKAGRGGGDFFGKLWRWFFPTADEIRWALEQSIPPDEQIEWFVREAKTPTHFRVAIAATNRHLVILSHFLIWRYYDFHPWNKLKDVTFTESPYHSKIIMTRIDTHKRVIIKHIESERGRLLAGHARKMIAVHEADKIALGKQCPRCKELVKYTALVCPNCRHEFGPQATPPTIPPSGKPPQSPQPPNAPTSNQEPKK